jgi:hypothetical protein
MLNNQHKVYVEISSGSGSATIDYGSVSPLVISEDDNDDMLVPIRTKTGYLKIVEQNFGDFDDIYPTSPTSHKVLTEDGFCGYLQPQAFSNGWEPGPRVLKIPVSSPMNLMDNTKSTIVGYNIKYRVLDMLLDALYKLEYDKIVLPRGLGNGDSFIFSFVSSLTVCPFAENDDYQYPTVGSIYAPKMISEVLEAICTRFGLILHDHCLGNAAIDNGMLVLTKNDYDGPYQLWTQDSLDQEEIPSDLAVTGNTVRNFSDYFEIAGDNNEDSLIQPYSKITFNNEGEQADDVQYHPEWSHYTNRDIYGNQHYHCMLQVVGNWLVSQKLTTTAITNAVALCGLYKPSEQQEKDAEEYILASMPGGTAQDYEMFRIRMIGAPPRVYRVSGIVKVAWSYNNDYIFPHENMGNFGLAVKYGNYYWDWDNGEGDPGWKTNPSQKIVYITPSETDGTFATPMSMDQPDDDIVADYYEIIFYFDPANDLYNYTKIFGDITLQTYATKATRKYVVVDPNKPIVIEGNSGSMSDAEVDLLFSRRNNSNFLTIRGGYFDNVNSEYLLHPQKIRKVTVKRTGVFDYMNYLCKWSFGDAFTWRLIAVSDDICNCERTLTFMGSTHI